MLPEHKTWIPAHKTLTPAHKTWIPAHKTLTPAHKTWTPAHKTSIRPEHNASPKFLKKKPALLDTPSPGQSRHENQHARLVSQRPRHRTIVFFFINLEIILKCLWHHLGSPQITHGPSQITYGSSQITHSSSQITHGSPQITHGSPQITHGSPQMTH